MMIRALLSAGILTSSILMPVAAYAYTTPDEVLDDDTFSARFFEAPPSRRNIADVLREQELRSAQRRQEEQSKLVKIQPESDDDSMHAAAPENSGPLNDEDIQALIEALNNSADDEDDKTDDEDEDDEDLEGEELRDARILARVKNRDSLYADNGEPLHSGAPLADTGPATILIAVAVVGAIGETWRRVRKMEKK
jgi:hypothetical protein